VTFASQTFLREFLVDIERDKDSEWLIQKSDSTSLTVAFRAPMRKRLQNKVLGFAELWNPVPQARQVKARHESAG